jgi:hypothetical protein
MLRATGDVRRVIPVDEGRVLELAEALLLPLGQQLGRLAGRGKAGVGTRIGIELPAKTLRDVRGERFGLRVRGELVVGRRNETQGTTVPGLGRGKTRGVGVSLEMTEARAAVAGSDLGLWMNIWVPVVADILLHELTHARDDLPALRPQEQVYAGEQDPERRRAYFNRPDEVRAHLQQIVREVLTTELPGEQLEKLSRSTRPGQQVEMLLAWSPTWEHVQPWLTEQNKRHVRWNVAQALAEHGKLVLGRRRLPR